MGCAGMFRRVGVDLVGYYLPTTTALFFFCRLRYHVTPFQLVVHTACNNIAYSNQASTHSIPALSIRLQLFFPRSDLLLRTLSAILENCPFRKSSCSELVT
eukprot:scaffold213222_cov28-Attheya_sp.AAC.1